MTFNAGVDSVRTHAPFPLSSGQTVPALYYLQMNSSIEALEKEVMRLPEDQRISLAHKILLSTEAAENAEIGNWWENEIRRRIETLDSGKTNRHAASDVFRDLDENLGR